MFNAHHNPLGFILAAAEWGQRWAPVLDTYWTPSYRGGKTQRADLVASRTLAVGARQLGINEMVNI